MWRLNWPVVTTMGYSWVRGYYGYQRKDYFLRAKQLEELEDVLAM